MCGSKVLPWHHFERFVLCVDERFNASTTSLPSRSTVGILSSAAMVMIALTRTPAGTSLLDLMDMSRYLQCEELRDRVNALFGLATTEAASIDPDYESDTPRFLNMIFRHHIEQTPEVSMQTVTSTCETLERLFGTQPGTIFELHGSPTHLPGRPGLLYRRLCSCSIEMHGLTLLWAIHYDHLRVQELIKMAHRLRSPAYYIFCGFQGVSFIVGLSLMLRFFSVLDHIAPLIGGVFFTTISVNIWALIIHTGFRIVRRLHHISRNSKLEESCAWSFETTLEHRSIWKTLWWVPFVIHECLIYITAPAYQPLKRWFLGCHLRWRGKWGVNSTVQE
jgi:hypothetical protein